MHFCGLQTLYCGLQGHIGETTGCEGVLRSRLFGIDYGRMNRYRPIPLVPFMKSMRICRRSAPRFDEEGEITYIYSRSFHRTMVRPTAPSPDFVRHGRRPSLRPRGRPTPRERGPHAPLPQIIDSDPKQLHPPWHHVLQPRSICGNGTYEGRDPSLHLGSNGIILPPTILLLRLDSINIMVTVMVMVMVWWTLRSGYSGLAHAPLVSLHLRALVSTRWRCL